MIDKNSPKISILMSVYNEEKTLAKAIDSILTQTYRDFEFIICDDASSDATPDLLKEYRERDERIALISHTENKGLAASLNDCLEIARGEYIARQDGDDVSKPE